jgi:hypothetical protein
MVLGILDGAGFPWFPLLVGCFIWNIVIGIRIFNRYEKIAKRKNGSMWFYKFKVLPYLLFIKKDPELPPALILHSYIAFIVFAIGFIMV